jgi:hypothetical protein
LQTVNGIDVVLNNGNNFGATFCLRSNLPIIPLALDNNTKQCFWNTAFGLFIDSFGDINTIKKYLASSKYKSIIVSKRAPSLAPTSIPRLSQVDSSYDAR